MDFITLDDVLDGIADRTADFEWSSLDFHEYARERSCSMAAKILHAALHNSRGKRLDWVELHSVTGAPVFNDAVCDEGMTLLEFAAGWYERKIKAWSEENVEPHVPRLGSTSDRQYPDTHIFGAVHIGFERAELVQFLDATKIIHSLGASQKELESARLRRNVIEIPAETEIIDASDIPNWIADKLVPVPDLPPTLQALTKHTRWIEKSIRIEELTTEDWALLDVIFHNLPKVSGNTTREQWEKNYQPRFESAQNKPEWTLQAQFIDPAEEASKERSAVRYDHFNRINDWIMAGKLSALTVRHTEADKLAPGVTISVENARAYLAGIQFELRETGQFLSKFDESRRPAKLFENAPSIRAGEGFSEKALNLTTLSRYLGHETWTPLVAVLLVCGIQPPQGCTEIPNGSMGLDNCIHMGTEDAFHEARRILELWNSRENPPSKIRPAEFVAWCKTYDSDILNKINTDWLSEIAVDGPEMWPKEDISFSSKVRTELSTATHWNEKQLEALCCGIPPALGEREGIVSIEERKRVRKMINEAIANGRLRAELDPNGNALYGKWRIDRIRAIKWAISETNGFTEFPDWLARSAIAEIILMQESEKHNAGRYNLEGAAQLIAENGGERYAIVLEKLVVAAEKYEISTYEPGRNAKIRYGSQPGEFSVVRGFHDEAYWDDLNQWLLKSETRITFRFPSPQGQVKAEDVSVVEINETPNLSKPNSNTDESGNIFNATEQGLSRRERQIRAIESLANEIGYSRTNIPKGGKKVLQQKCKAKWPELFGAGNDPFLDAWKKAVREKRIRIADHEKFSRR